MQLLAQLFGEISAIFCVFGATRTCHSDSNRIWQSDVSNFGQCVQKGGSGCAEAEYPTRSRRHVDAGFFRRRPLRLPQRWWRKSGLQRIDADWAPIGQGPYLVQCPRPLDRRHTKSNVHSRGRILSKVHGLRTGAVPCPMSTALQRPRAVAWLSGVIVVCIPIVLDVCRALRCALVDVPWYPVLRHRHHQCLAASPSPVEVRTPPADCTRWGEVRLGRCPPINAPSRRFTGRYLDSAIQRRASSREEPTSLRIVTWLPVKTTTSPPEIAPRASDPRLTRCPSRTRVRT